MGTEQPGRLDTKTIGFLISFATSISVATGALWVEVGKRREQEIKAEHANERFRDTIQRMDKSIQDLADNLRSLTRRDSGGFFDPDFSAALDRHLERVGGEKFERRGAARERWRALGRENPSIKIPALAEN